MMLYVDIACMSTLLMETGGVLLRQTVFSGVPYLCRNLSTYLPINCVLLLLLSSLYLNPNPDRKVE